MLNVTTNGQFGMVIPSPKSKSKSKSKTRVTSYAADKNARFNDSADNIICIDQRFNDTLSALPEAHRKAVIYSLQAAVAEFRLRNPQYKSYKDIKKALARSIDCKMIEINIDTTMQRLLNIEWVIELLLKFCPTKVVPIQVYQQDPTSNEYLAWDGQHTVVLLWLIATQVFGENPKTLMVPVNIYSSNFKPEMRQSFISLSSPDGKRMLDQFDLFEQMVYGVRIDKSTNPLWLLAEEKQTVIESYDLFLTGKKFGDHENPGAISRMQEVNKLSVESLNWLCQYLVAVGGQNRPIEEKEMVMMAYFFDRCKHISSTMTRAKINEMAAVIRRHWRADFGPTSMFWVRADLAYKSWHSKFINNGNPRFNKEPIHGYPFLIEQLKKDLPHHTFPESRTNSEFIPTAADLF